MLELQEINPFIRYCKPAPQPAQYDSFVKAYDCRLFYILDGNGIFYVAGQIYKFHKHSLIYIPSGVEYRFSYRSEVEILFQIVNFDLVCDHIHVQNELKPDSVSTYNLSQMIPIPDVTPFSEELFISTFEAGYKDFLTLNDLYVNKPPLFNEIGSGILKKILMTMVSSQLSETASRSGQTVDLLLSYIRNNYHKPITNQTIAQEFNFHPYYINRIIKNATGESLHHYLIGYRIKEAQHLLSTSASPVYVISSLVGFGTPSQFSSTFKKITGQSPIEYRALHKSYL